MTVQESLTRHGIIISKLRAKASSFEEIMDRLSLESDLHEMNFEISKRTFQRDLNEIRSLHHIDIKFDRSQKVYFINEDFQNEYSKRLFEVMDVFQMLKMDKRLSDFVEFSTRKPMGTEHLSGLLYATQNRFQLQLNYKKFDNDLVDTHLVEPYLLKEFRNRWYLHAYNIEKKEFRTFGLDRIQSMRILDIKFQYPQKVNPREHFKNSFGIVSSINQEPQEIVLKFFNNQGEYVRTLPLHSSQQILEEDGDSMLVKLKIVPTYDFVFELMSMGSNLKVISPKSLADDLRGNFRRALQYYD
jgi:predicted DNA-binding transcriptional regulator YafY